MILLVVPPLAVVSTFFQRKILANQREVRKTSNKIPAPSTRHHGRQNSKTLVREDRNVQDFPNCRHEKVSVRSASLSAIYLPIRYLHGSIATALLLTQGQPQRADRCHVIGYGDGISATPCSFSSPFTTLQAYLPRCSACGPVPSAWSRC